jgi:hypothetical protein
VRTDRGAGTVLILGLCGLVATVGVGTAALGVLFDAREKAAAAAEAAALAAAVATYPAAADGPPARLASMMAGHNGARMISCSCDLDASLDARVVAVTVALTADVPLFGEVDVGRTARAEFEPRLWLGR